MRIWAMAGLMSAALAGAAWADAWTDPNGRLSFNAPAGWTIQDQNQAGMTYVIAGNADQECHVLAIPRAETATATPGRVRAAAANDATFTNDVWLRTATAMRPIFTTPPAVAAHSSDSSQFWPIQRAELQGERAVHAAIQLRPGVELQTYCQTYEGNDDTAKYDAFIRSIGTPNDAALQAQAEQEAAAQAAPAPAHH